MATYLAAGAVTEDMFRRFAIVLPALVVPSLLGARVYKKLDQLAFRQVVLTLLFGAGLVMVAASLSAAFGRQ